MRAHAIFSINDRIRAFEELRQEIQGRAPRGPFEFADDLEFASVAPANDDPPAVKRFKAALQRDLKYSSAGAVYLQAFSFSQNLRSIYDGGRQLIDGGAKTSS
jgi:hypothetical protein